MGASIELFYSYAHEDQDLLHELRRQFLVHERNKAITNWYDRLVPPGSGWKGQIDERLQKADVILLLVSEFFFQSDYCHDVEMQEALRRHERGLARVIPVILSPCMWEAAAFAHLQVVPSEGKPITSWADRKAACVDVARQVMSVVAEIVATRGPVGLLRVEDVAPQAPRVTSGPPTPSGGEALGNVLCESGLCRSSNVVVRDSAEISEIQATDDGWIARGTLQLKYGAVGECLTCGRIFSVVSRLIPVQFPDITCRECGESAFLKYRVQSLAKTSTGYRFEVIASCEVCHAVKRVAQLLPQLERTTALEIRPTGMIVKHQAPEPPPPVERL